MDSVKVYQAINAVQSDLCIEGISKSRKNQMQKYNFRGIDDVFNALSPLLAKHKLCILPRMISREVVERKTKKGDPLFYVTLSAEFDFISSVDASKHTISVFGEAMDSSDKATNKAMSAAYKYACLQAFSVPTEASDDADRDSPAPAPVSFEKKRSAQKSQSAAPRINTVDEAKSLIKSSKNLKELRGNWVYVWNCNFSKDDRDTLEIAKDDRKGEIEDLANSFAKESGINASA